MSDKKINQFSTSSVSDNSLGVIGDPNTGALTQTSFRAMKDYFQQGITGSGGNVDTGSLATTASLNSFITVYHIDSASFDARIISATGSTINTGSLLSTASFNSFTSSYFVDSSSFLVKINKTGSTYPAESTIGTISNLSSWNNYSQWQPAPFQTVTLDNTTGYVDIAGAAASYTAYVKYQPYSATCLNHWKRQVTFKIKAWDANSSFFGIGAKSLNTSDNTDLLGYIGVSSTGVGGLTLYNNGSTGTTLGTNVGFTNHLNDVIQMTLTFDDGVMTYSAQNLTTTSASGIISYTFTETGSAPKMPNTSTTGFWYFSTGAGVIEIQNVLVSSTEVKNPNNLFIVDSKYSYFATNFGSRWFETLNNLYPSTIVNGGQGDTVALSVLRKAEILSENPENVFLQACSNDIRYGRTLSQLESDILTVKSWFDNTSTNFKFFILPENSSGSGVNLNPLHAWAISSSAISGSYMPQFFVSMSVTNSLNPIYNSGDDIHSNQLGHTFIANLFTASGQINTIDPNRKTPFLSGDTTVRLTGNSVGSFWNTDRALNYLNKWDSGSNSVPSNIIDNGSKVIISPNQNIAPVFTNSSTTLGIHGYITTAGSQSGILIQDQVNNANNYYINSANNFFTIGYNGVQKIYISGSTGDMNIGGRANNWIGSGLYVSKDTTVNNDFYGSNGAFLLTVDKSTLSFTGVGPIVETAPVKIMKSVVNVPGSTMNFTNVSSLFIEGAPISTGSANVSSSWGIRLGSGNAFLGGNLIVSQSVGIGVLIPSSSLDIPASTTTRASLNIKSGSAPSFPNDGDIWYDGISGTLKMRISGSTKTFTMS